MAILTDEEKRDILSSLTLWDDRFFSSCFDGDIESASLILGIILEGMTLRWRASGRRNGCRTWQGTPLGWI